MINIISLGAGVQSSTMALMAAQEAITPMPDCAIFADTGWEPQAVYEWLEYLEGSLPFPVHRVSAGDLIEDVEIRTSKKSGKTYLKNSIPFWTDTDGKKGALLRKCTRDYKLDPIRKLQRTFGKDKNQVIWIGISTDEAHRMKPSTESWITNRFPLMEERMSRGDCLAWLDKNYFPEPPRSACIFCPYHSNGEWSNLQKNWPDEFQKAAEIESQLQKLYKQAEVTTADNIYLHDSLFSLDEIDFNETQGQLNLFGNECEGMCGV